jgi:hypothetical protein
MDMDRAEQHIQAAMARGAISETRAAYWRTMAASGHDVSALDDLASAHGPQPVRASGGLGYVGAVYGARPGMPPGPPAGAGPMFAANPILAELERDRPALVAAARADGPPPELFEDGPLPAFCASGLDPSLLAALPWPVRRPIAAAPSLAAAYALWQQYAGPDGDAAGLLDLRYSRENSGYVSAMSQWLMGAGVGRDTNAQPPQGPGVRASADPADLAGRVRAETQADSADYVGQALYDELFGPS